MTAASRSIARTAAWTWGAIGSTYVSSNSRPAWSSQPSRVSSQRTVRTLRPSTSLVRPVVRVMANPSLLSRLCGRGGTVRSARRDGDVFVERHRQPLQEVQRLGDVGLQQAGQLSGRALVL